MKVSLYIGESKLDLFEDENIEINSSVTDVEDIEKNTTEYSKDFTVPASNNNNRLFKHYYNADIDNGFDARVKVNGSILINGFIFKLGKYRLSKVNVKNGKPSSYTIQFWGNLLSLKDVLGNSELSDLDLTAYNHSYDSDNVKEGLTTSLFDGNLVYSLFPKKQYYYNSDSTDVTNTEKLVNINYGNGSGSNGIAFNDLRPSLKLIRIIESIEVYSGITFSRDFFGRPEFTNLFLWLNPDADKSVGGNTQIIDWDSGDNDYMNLVTNIGSYPTSNTSASNDNYHWDIYLTILPTNPSVEYTIIFYVDDEVKSEITTKGTQTLPRYELYVADANENPHTYNVYWELKASQELFYLASLRQEYRKSNDSAGSFTTYASTSLIESNFIVKNELPKIKIIDFLKGLFKMFKLVVIPTDYNSLYVNSLVDYYAEGNLHNITNYVDNSEYTVNRGTLLREINFLFQEPTTILNIEFEKNNNKAYGDEENEINDETGKPLDGDSLDYTVPFEQIVYERLNDINTEEIKDFQYGLILDEALENANPKPHIFYNINITTSNTNVAFVTDIGVKELLPNTLNIPSHTMTIDNVYFSTVFSEEFSEYTGVKISNTLYKNYHKTYIDAIFNEKRRDYSFNAKLPFRILNKLNLNDVLKIKNNYYRINDYNINLLTGVTQLNLISSFDNTINEFSASTNNIYVDYKAQTQSIYITNLGNATFNKVDSGYDVDWVSVTNSLNSVFFTFAYNDTGIPREMFVDITNEEATKTIRVYINQSGENTTVDNTIITVDNNLITVDNG